jgi:hypothetical protein
MYPSQFESDGV